MATLRSRPLFLGAAVALASCMAVPDDDLEIDSVEETDQGVEIDDGSPWQDAEMPPDEGLSLPDGLLAAADPTGGWKRQTFQFKVHHPFDLPESARHTFDEATNTHTMTILKTDSPLKKGSPTSPRTEMRWNNDYTSGEHMFDADVNITPGTDGSSIMQIFRGVRPNGGPATAIMLVAHKDGTVRRYFGANNSIIKSNATDNWWNLKVAHNPATGEIKIYADNKLVLTSEDRGKATHYFKNGVYGVTSRSQVRFRNIKYWVR
jgi:hypothetical protein